MKCEICGKNSESIRCFQHKVKKPLNNTKSTLTSRKREVDVEAINEMHEFFIKIWKKRRHYSEVSGVYLGSEPLSIFFHHILPKEKYPEARLDEENIVLLTLDEHTNIENDMYKFEDVNDQRMYLKIKHNL